MYPMIPPLSAELRQAERRELDSADIGVDHPRDSSAWPCQSQEARGLLLGGPAAESTMHSLVEQACAAVEPEERAPYAPDDDRAWAMAAQVLELVPRQATFARFTVSRGRRWQERRPKDSTSEFEAEDAASGVIWPA